MPFKALSSVKKVATLAGEVRHIAELGPDGLIGALTTDPVTLAVNPVGTGTAKTAKIALDEAHEFAFLSKLVAVVRANDDLWGLIDIAHTPKLEQSGHNFRGLAASANGESALGLSWDGRGAVLNLRKNEVIGRDFALRGDVRAVALWGNECFAVVDGGGASSQYRVHAGPTPEAAPHVRTDLPAEARELDRLRATNELGVIYKRQADSVCIVRRQANTANAKMVTFEQKALDCAVIASSLFMIGADGKLRLYNSDVLAKATGEVMTPTVTMDMRVDGEPSALGTSTKRGSTVWLGTKRGELIRVEAIKGGLDLPA